MREIGEIVRTMPKVELHVHLEGTLEPELKLRLAERNGIPFPFETVEQVRAAYRFHDLPSFLTGYYEGMDVLRTEADFYDLTSAYLRRAAGEGVRYAEVFFDPQAHTARGIPFGTLLRGIRRAQLDAARRHDLHTQLVMCFLRDHEAGYAMATLLESLPYKEWIVGVGLDSDEHGNPPRKFAEVFRRARQEGYLLTAHCDIDQQDSVEHIRQCLHEIGVDRIDHGSNVLEAPELVAEAQRRGTGFTTCPVSNSWVNGGGTKADEIGRMLAAELAVTVNSDDPAYFGAYLTDNLLALHAELELAPADLVRLQLNAVRASWAPLSIKDRLTTALRAEY